MACVFKDSVVWGLNHVMRFSADVLFTHGRLPRKTYVFNILGSTILFIRFALEGKYWLCPCTIDGGGIEHGCYGSYGFVSDIYALAELVNKLTS